MGERLYWADDIVTDSDDDYEQIANKEQSRNIDALIHAYFDYDQVPLKYREYFRNWFSNLTYRKIDEILPEIVGPEGYVYQYVTEHEHRPYSFGGVIYTYTRESGDLRVMPQQDYARVRTIIKTIAQSGREVGLF